MPDSQWRAGMNTGTVSRDQAKREILTLASGQGIDGAFKVFYNDQLVVTPDDLPEQVDMSRVRVSEVLDQAIDNSWFEFRGKLHAVSL